MLILHNINSDVCILTATVGYKVGKKRGNNVIFY